MRKKKDPPITWSELFGLWAGLIFLIIVGMPIILWAILDEWEEEAREKEKAKNRR